MKKSLFTLFLGSFLFIQMIGFTQSCELTIVVKDIKDIKGKLRIGLFSNAENFKLKANPVDSAVIEITSKTISYTFKHLNNGTYAVAVYHDENGDDILNKRQLGIPVEGIGFSNFQTKQRKPPDFNEVSFDLKTDLAINIPLFYNKK